MANMTSQHEDMLYDNSLNRSPSNATPRGYNPTGLNRQPSRNFEQSYHAQHQPGLYASELHQFENRTQRLPPPQQLYNNTSYNHNPYQDWNAYAGSNAATMGASSRMRPSNRRAPLPTNWTDNGTPQLSSYIPSNQYAQMPAQHMAPYSNSYDEGPQSHAVSQGGSSPNMGSPEDPDELILTAIVIKNIPFAVKKEQLQQLMTEMGLPVPYAFNYHFDSGVFRGLAFANFSSAEDTAHVIHAMNALDLQGRKLRVEYKKMLPQQERDRIEREKRERRGQLEEQHRPQPMGLQTQTSMSSLTSQMIPRTSPSPVSTRGNQPTRATGGVLKDVDMNDPQTLEYYSQLLKFKDGQDPYITFEAPLPPEKRKILHSLSHFLGLHHIAHGNGDGRFLQILKQKPDPSYQPKLLQHTSNHGYDERRALARAATVDFSEIRPNDPSYYPTLRSQASDYLGVPQSPGGESGINRAGGLRGAKSFGDLQARTASPSSLSTSSFPAGLTQNASRYASEYNTMNGAHAGDVPSATNGRVGQDDSFINGFAGMSVFDRPLMPTRSNGRLGPLNDDQGSTSGPIGSQRPVHSSNGNFDDQPRNNGTVAPERQPRVPTSNWNGFPRPRQNGHVGRGSDELDQHQIEEAWRRN